MLALVAAVVVVVMGPVRGHGVEAGLYDLAGKLKVALVGASGPSLQAPNPVLSPPEITVSQPVLRKTIEWDEYTGRFDAVEAVDVRARVSGYLAKVNFTDGQEVKAGDLLFEIDPRPLRARARPGHGPARRGQGARQQRWPGRRARPAAAKKRSHLEERSTTART